MSGEIWQTILQVAITAALGVFGWLIRQATQELNHLRNKLQEHSIRLTVIETMMRISQPPPNKVGAE